MLMAVIGFAFAANAQADQCKLEGGADGYINAYVSESTHMHSNVPGVGPHITITTTPSKDQPADGKVLCKVTYIRKDTGEERTDPNKSIDFKKSGSCENKVFLDYEASRIISVEIWGAECKSASRPW